MTALALPLPSPADDEGTVRGWRVGDRVKCRYGSATIVEIGVTIDECDGEFIAVKPDRLADQFLVRAKELVR